MLDLSTPTVRVDAPPDAQFSYAEMQNAIDQIYDLRAKVVRIGLLGTLLDRPDPMRETSPEEQAEILTFLESQIVIFDTVTRMMETGAQHQDLSAEMCRWLHRCATEKPAELGLAVKVNMLGQRILADIRAESDGRSASLAEHMQVARAGYHDAITALCTHMWATYEITRAAQLDKAREAARAMDKKLTRLERIGTHVRLVSLNASVEAARIGDAGRGLSVIAHEFKELAEEIGQLTREAQQNVVAMQINT